MVRVKKSCASNSIRACPRRLRSLAGTRGSCLAAVLAAALGWMIAASTLGQAPKVSLLPTPSAKSDPVPAPERLVLDEFPGALVAEVVVPVPGEVFSVLDKLGAPDWTGQLREIDGELPADRAVLSLAFGATVAEGFLAVQAERAENVKSTGRRLLKMGTALGIENRVRPHYQSILDSADAGNWRAIRAEIDRTQQTVRLTLEEMRDDDLATLISLGGWLRGTETLTTLIGEAFSGDRAELLNQPDLVLHFFHSIEGMDQQLRQHEDVAAVASGLTEIYSAMTVAASVAGSAAGEVPAPADAQEKAAEDGSGKVAENPSQGSQTAEANPATAQAVIGVEAVRRIEEVCRTLLLRFYSDPEAAAE